ncbi:MAG: hypothetical protein HYY40_03675 [Bacteroidetes bacterium]|nr:hypothetical protein [Bacteroidota bacterium]
MDYRYLISFFDWLLAAFYIIFIIITAAYLQKKYITENPVYKFFIWGLVVKIGGAVSVCLIYIYYYKEGGDTLGYHIDCLTMLRLLFQEPLSGIKVIFGLGVKEELFFLFNYKTGYPGYWNDTFTFNVVRLIVPLEILALKSYLVASILMGVISFTGIWKLYLMLCRCRPGLYRQFAIAVLFIPSVIFWGSGILKDSWTLAAVGWFCHSFYGIFIRRDYYLKNFIALALSILIMVAVKPYIFVGLLPGCLLWMIWEWMMSIRNIILRILLGPFISLIGVGTGLLLWMATSPNLGQYASMDKIIFKAHVSYMDLKQDYYHGNSFDLGYYEPTLGGIFSKFPIATMTGLFRPFIWEAKNIVMIFSGLETLVIVAFTLFVILRRPQVILFKIVNDPLVLFCLIFAIFFAFSVAISTSNFGAMVRFRIPLMPFYLSGLFLLNYSGQWKSIREK